MDRQQVHETINQLVESRDDLREAQTRQNEFNQTRTPPRPPDGFGSLQSFLDFYEEKQGFEEEQQRLETEVEKAKHAYNEAESTLTNILPDNAPLTYDYEGERQQFAGERFTITNRALYNQREIVVASSRPTTE